MSDERADAATLMQAGADLIAAADHSAATTALRHASSVDLRDTLRELRTAVMSVEPQTLRRSVGFWGRLIGRDIVLDAEARDLRERSTLLLRKAEGHINALHCQHDELKVHAARLQHAIEALQPVIDALAANLVTSSDEDLPAQARAARFAHLVTLRTTYSITTSQLAVVAGNMLTVADRCSLMLPRIAVLLDQHRALNDSRDETMRLSSARQVLDELDRHVDVVTHGTPETPATSKTEPT